MISQIILARHFDIMNGKNQFEVKIFTGKNPGDIWEQVELEILNTNTQAWTLDSKQAKDLIATLVKAEDYDYRVCDVCGVIMQEGFCINGGEEYYCTKRCLYTRYSEKEWLELYDEGRSDSYYTTWGEK